MRLRTSQDVGRQAVPKMTKQIKKLLIAELSSKRTLARSLNVKLPCVVSRSDDRSSYVHMLHFDNKDCLFHFETYEKSDSITIYLRSREVYHIKDLQQELKLSKSWFEPFVNEE